MLKRVWRIVAWLAPALMLAGCLSAPERPLRVFAAASLHEPFVAIGARYEKEHPGRKVEFQFAGTQILAAQIEQGAPADVFASADIAHMDAVHGKHLVGPPVLFAHNHLVVITPRSGTRVNSLADLAKPGVRIVLADESVPAGRYSRRAIASLGASGRYGPQFQRRAMENVASLETNVRGVLAKVALGEADAGIVYVTDARTEAGRLRRLEIPEESNPRADYPIAVVSRSSYKAAAEDFIRLTAGAEGQRILGRYGFAK